MNYTLLHFNCYISLSCGNNQNKSELVFVLKQSFFITIWKYEKRQYQYSLWKKTNEILILKLYNSIIFLTNT